ncbi:uncharacterized protein LOC142357929, partial [Convolutriloba macropyga]|uniref:uncharacterized protein LOC142357929 n=1 Tax=Convolutriloba macropyga TaxID=536237 RepID=UPI003F51D83E
WREFCSIRLHNSTQSIDVVALVKLHSPVLFVGSRRHHLPICEEVARQGDLIGVCGLGLTSRIGDMNSFANSLMEAYFSVSYLESGFIPIVDPVRFCRDEDICTNTHTPGSNSITSFTNFTSLK